ncbi:family 78 glycoside hydrolase catalytic domain [Massilioclostridium coli]|uniref:family 78 glycoside hydrolase catalytic domain n=1 Tax=Massilioclostridium coli TaxID=1870991 RepID=UPI0022DFFE5C|nr:family 78 glycoside hydrolase catalytic domain [Massilioclostridium coli]
MNKSNASKKALALLLSISMLAAVTCTNPFVSATNDDIHTSIVEMTTNYQDGPIGVDTEGIHFSWKMDSNLIGQEQASYQIIVTKDSPDGEVVWDSGVVKDDTSVGIDYAGDPLEWETRYYWTVTVCDKNGDIIKSKASSFETACDWKNTDAKWVMVDNQEDTDQTVPLFRGEYSIPEGEIESARLYMSALGIYEAYVNGQEVKSSTTDGTIIDDSFNPGWTDYTIYVNGQTYDVTDLIDGTDVTIAATVGRGWYKGKIARSKRFTTVIGDDSKAESALIAKLVVNYKDGTQAVLNSDGSTWKTSLNSPYLNNDTEQNDFYNGEIYDANVAQQIEGWNDSGYNDDSWDKANDTGEYIGYIRPTSVMASHFSPENNQKPVGGYTYSEINLPTSEGGTSELDYGEVVEKPVDVNGDITVPAGETLILKLAQNMVGVENVTFQADQGTQIKLRFAEMLNDGRKNPKDENGGSDGPKGSIQTAHLRAALCTDLYTMGSNGVETYQPNQTFHGFQYIEISADQDIVVKQFTGKVITSTTEQTGFIQTSNADVNQLFSNVIWGQRGNYLSIPTDCPQRNERSGWTGDAQVFSGTGVYNFDSIAFLEEYEDIMNAHRNKYNSYGWVMPAGWGKDTSKYDFTNSCGWSDAGIIIPWTMYQQTGDLSLIESQYDEMDAYMDQVGEKGYDKTQFGDWLAFQGASVPYLNQAFRAYTAQLMSKMSALLGKTDKVAKYDQLFEETRQAVLDKYVTEDGDLLTSTADKVYVSKHGYPIVDNAQCGLLWALKLGFYENETQKQVMIDNLLKNIHNENGSMREGYAEDTLAVGFLGVNVILPVLTDIGEGDVAYKLLVQDQMPSWLYSVKNGATTIWERWNSYSKEDSFADNSMTSFNHYSYGAVAEWMYKYMSGITMDEQKPGFKEIILQPTLDENQNISFVNGSYNSYYGNIESNWTANESGQLQTYQAIVPANTSATLYLPISEEIAKTYQQISGVTFVQMTEHNGCTVAEFELAAGGYDFAVADGNLTVSLADGYVSDGSTVDKDILNTVIEYAQTQKSSEEFNNVIADVQKSFNQALDNAVAVAQNKDATQEEVDSAWQTLLNEIHKLGFVKGDISSLETLVSLAESYDLNQYVEQGKSEFEAALITAQALISDKDNAMADEIATAENNLLNAMLNLRFKADKSILEKIMTKASGIEATAYTAESYDVLQAAMAHANKVLENDNATQEEVDIAAQSVQTAIDHLVTVAEKQPAEDTTPSTDTAILTGQKSTTPTVNAAKTGDMIPVAGAVIAVAAGAVIFLTRRKK